MTRLLTLAALAVLTGTAPAADLRWSVYDKKTDKKLLDLDGKTVEDAGGTRILSLSGSRIENRGGAAVLMLDKDSTTGFSVRNPKDMSVRLLWGNGHQLCKRVQEGVVFHYDGRNRYLAADSTGPAVYTLTCHNGNLDSRLQPWQVVAIAYALRPDLFKVDAAAAKAQRDEAMATEKAEDTRVANRLKGEFMVVTSSAAPFKKGKATATPVGKYFHMSYAFDGGPKLQGIGLFLPSPANDEEEIVTALSADGAVGLGIYEITPDGLSGTWHPTTLLADPKLTLGTETLTGKTAGDDLTGRFAITAAKTPGKGDSYSGTLDVARVQRADGGIRPVYQLTWTLGTYKLTGAGVAVDHFGTNNERKKYLIAAAGAGEVLVGQHWHPSSSGVQLDFAASGKGLAGGAPAGFVMLTK